MASDEGNRASAAAKLDDSSSRLAISLRKLSKHNPELVERAIKALRVGQDASGGALEESREHDGSGRASDCVRVQEAPGNIDDDERSQVSSISTLVDTLRRIRSGSLQTSPEFAHTLGDQMREIEKETDYTLAYIRTIASSPSDLTEEASMISLKRHDRAENKTGPVQPIETDSIEQVPAPISSNRFGRLGLRTSRRSRGEESAPVGLNSKSKEKDRVRAVNERNRDKKLMRRLFSQKPPRPTQKTIKQRLLPDVAGARNTTTREITPKTPANENDRVYPDGLVTKRTLLAANAAATPQRSDEAALSVDETISRLDNIVARLEELSTTGKVNEGEKQQVPSPEDDKKSKLMAKETKLVSRMEKNVDNKAAMRAQRTNNTHREADRKKHVSPVPVDQVSVDMGEENSFDTASSAGVSRAYHDWEGNLTFEFSTGDEISGISSAYDDNYHGYSYFCCDIA